MTESASFNTVVSPKENPWLKRLHALENALALAYAISLPLSMTASWVLLTAALIALAVDLLVPAPARKQLLSHAPLMVPMFVLTAAVAASGIENGGMSEAVRFVYSLKALLAYFFSSLCFSRYPRLSKNVLVAVLGVGAIAGLWGSYQQVFNFHPLGYKWLQGTGFLGGPMAYAGQMQLLSMLALGLLFTGGYRQLPLFMSGRAIFVLITVANVLGLIFAGERGAWLGGLVGVLAATALISWRKFLTAVVAISIVGSLSYLFVPLVHTRVDGMLSPSSDAGSRQRIIIWHRAIQEWQRSPLLGIGFLKFPPLDIPEAIVPGHSRVIDHAHSNYFHLLATTGIFGLIAFAYLLFSILRHSRRLYLTGLRAAVPFLSGCGNGLFAATVSLAVAGLFEYNFGTAQVRLAQWFLLGLLGLLP